MVIVWPSSSTMELIGMVIRIMPPPPPRNVQVLFLEPVNVKWQEGIFRDD